MRQHSEKHSILRIALIAGILALNPYSSRSQGISAIWANEGGDKVAREELRMGKPNGRPVINAVWDGSKMTLKGARNEVVNFNLILEATSRQASGVAVHFSGLTSSNGFEIGSVEASGDGVFNWVGRNIELFYIRYLPIKGLSLLGYENYYDERHVPERFRRPWTGEGRASGTWEDRPDHDAFYPDIAIPLELLPGFSIAPGTNQSIWVDVYIPKTASAGLYSGTITITEDAGSTHSIPVDLTVYDFSLPDLPTAKTMLYWSGNDINERYFGIDDAWVMENHEALAKQIQDRHLLLAHRHKISLIGDDSWINSDYTTEDRPGAYFAACLNGSFYSPANGYDGPGVNTGNNVYSVGTYGSWQDWSDTETEMRDHSDRWARWFEEHAPETDYFLYLIDESNDYPLIEKWSKWLARNPGAGKGLKSLATLSLPDAAEHTPTLSIPASAAGIGITGQWENYARQYRDNPEKMFFLYNGSRPAAGCFMTEDDGVALRVNAWIQFKKQIDRWFYWQSTYYNDFQGGTGRVDLFTTAHTFGSFDSRDPEAGETGWNYSNGDGVLFYPGTDRIFPASSYQVNGPFASLRMKYWRRGLQDHDYLSLAAQSDPDAVARIVEQMIPKVVWEVGVEDPDDPTWIHTDISWPVNPDIWEAARDSLAAIILRSSPSNQVVKNRLSGSEDPILYNFPNPFCRSTTFVYSIPVPGRYTLKIYDYTGREMITLLNTFIGAGSYSIEWSGASEDGLQAGSGFYFCELKNEYGHKCIKKMLLLH